MLKTEFEKLAKRTVTDEQYRAIDSLYMCSNLNKYDFVKGLSRMLKSIPEESHNNKIITITTTDRCGCERTPNGCYIHTIKAELVDVDIATGRVLVKEIPGSYELGYLADKHYYEVTFVGETTNPLFEKAGGKMI